MGFHHLGFYAYFGEKGDGSAKIKQTKKKRAQIQVLRLLVVLFDLCN